MDAWLIVLITIVSGITLFSILFSIKLRKNKRNAAARNLAAQNAYAASIVLQPSQTSNPQDTFQQMPYSSQQTPYPQSQQTPYPQSQQTPYPQSQNMPYPPQQNQQLPYPPQMPYPQQSNQYSQQPNFPAQTQAMSFIPSTNNQPLITPQQYFSPPQGIIVSTAPYNPSPSAPPINRY